LDGAFTCQKRVQKYEHFSYWQNNFLENVVECLYSIE